MPMDYNLLIAKAREFVPESIGIDMCRHESVTDPTYWLFRDSQQIGSVAYEPSYAAMWRACRMSRGMPTAERRFGSLPEALQFAIS